MSSYPFIVDAAEKLYPLVTNKLFSTSLKTFGDEKWSLLELHKWKSAELPKTLAQRQKDGKVFINKQELTLLMQWKLSVGKFRPMLPKLIASNAEEDVESASADAFRVFLTHSKSGEATLLPEYQRAVREALKHLCKLRGVGPATASLVLCLLTEISDSAPPFFSDECFMYLVRDVLRPDASIKYNVKEYVDELIPVLHRISLETKKPMEFLQRGAWALKSYDLLKLSTLADLKLPFKVDEANLFCCSNENPSKTTAKNSTAIKKDSKDTKRKIKDAEVTTKAKRARK